MNIKIFIIGVLVSMLTVVTASRAQVRTYATTYVSSSGEVVYPTHSSDGDVHTYTELECWTAFLGLGTHGVVTNAFSGNQPSGTAVYIILSQPGDASFLRTLLGGTLGAIVNTLLDGLVAGMPRIEVSLLNNSGLTVTSETMTPSSGADIMIGSDGLMYLKVMATGVFRRVKVDISNPAVLGLGNNMIVRVHDIFTVSPSSSPCDDFRLTSYDATGLSVSLITDNGLPVTDPHHAIDHSDTTYSQLGYSGVLSLYAGSTISQTVLFDELSTTYDRPVMVFHRNASLLTLDLLNAIQIEVYNDATMVYSGTAGSLLSLDALGILSASLLGTIPDRITVPVMVPFNKVVVKYSQTVGLGVTDQPLKIYDINVGPMMPVLNKNYSSGCPNEPVDVFVTSPVAGHTYQWLSTSLSLLHTGSSLDGMIHEAGNMDTVLVRSVNACGISSQFEYLIIEGYESISTPPISSNSF